MTPLLAHPSSICIWSTRPLLKEERLCFRSARPSRFDPEQTMAQRTMNDSFAPIAVVDTGFAVSRLRT